MKSSSLIFNVVARRPAVSTIAFEPKRMPLGLIRNTLPFAKSWPNITDGSAPITLFNAIADELGWKNCTSSSIFILKPFQLMIALSVA